MTLTLEWINEDYYQDEGRIEKRIFKSNFELFIQAIVDSNFDYITFYHKAGRYLAGRLLSDATVEILKIIGNTKWQGDSSWWISQKDVYERFFNYSWTEENILESFRSAHTEFANHD